jgi:hypothetical protein
VPTTLPRCQVSLTEPVRLALDRANQIWPGEPKSKHLTRLILAGASTLASDIQTEQRRLAKMIKYADCYPPGYLDDLRSEWERT